MTANPPSRLTLVCATLGAGGAERVLTTLANAWNAAGTHVTLVTLSAVGTDFYRVDTGVERVGLGVLGNSTGPLEAMMNNWRRLQALRRAFTASRPDAIISFMDVTNVQVLLAARGMGVPVIVSERIDPRYHPIGRLWGKLRKRMYLRAAALVVQTHGVAEWARTVVPTEKVHVIPNPLPQPAGEVADPRSREQTIVGMGRLDPQKGFDLLLRAFAHATATAAGWRLLIYGEGSQRGELLQLADQLEIAEKVSLPGKTTEPHTVLSQCGIFVLSSRYEGMPNVLMEAMAAGAPCVSFNCPSGPADIIEHGENGLLVRHMDVDGLAAAIGRLVGDVEQRASLGASAQAVRERFSVERVFEQWNALLMMVCGR